MYVGQSEENVREGNVVRNGMIKKNYWNFLILLPNAFIPLMFFILCSTIEIIQST